MRLNKNQKIRIKTSKAVGYIKEYSTFNSNLVFVDLYKKYKDKLLFDKTELFEINEIENIS